MFHLDARLIVPHYEHSKKTLIMNETLSPEDLHVLRHSLGLGDDGKGKSYRNRYVCHPEPPLQRLVAIGLMQDHGPYEFFRGMHCYSATTAGIEAAMPQRNTQGSDNMKG